jgi:hypothetical protein
MTEPVKVKVRPGHSLRFPAMCVHCSRPATERMCLRHSSDGATRLIDVPLCGECHRELRRQSHLEERLQKVGRISSGAAALVAITVLLMVLPGWLPFLLRLSLALLGGALAAAAVQTFFRRGREAAARPEKRAILRSAAMVAFSWRTATFVFENDGFASRFAELNRTQLMEG